MKSNRPRASNPPNGADRRTPSRQAAAEEREPKLDEMAFAAIEALARRGRLDLEPALQSLVDDAFQPAAATAASPDEARDLAQFIQGFAQDSAEDLHIRMLALAFGYTYFDDTAKGSPFLETATLELVRAVATYFLRCEAHRTARRRAARG